MLQPLVSRQVTQIGPWPPPFGGMSIHLLRLVAGLRSRGWDVSVLAAARTPPGAGSGSPFIGNSLWRHLAWTRRHARGVVHLHDRLSPLTLAATLAVRSRQLPLVLTLHGEPHSALTRRSGLDPFHRAAIRQADRIVAVNRHVAEALAGIAVAERISIIPAYLPPVPGEDAFVSQPLRRWLDGDPGSPLLVALVYRILPPLASRTDVYGIDLITALCEHLTAQGMTLRLALLVAQAPREEAEKSYMAAHETRLRTALGGRLGLFYGEYAPPAIARASVFLRPTRTDGDAVSVREALALGVPVVASDVAPRPTGAFLHRAGSVESLLDAVRTALDSGATQRAPGAGEAAGLDALECVYQSVGGTLARAAP